MPPNASPATGTLTLTVDFGTGTVAYSGSFAGLVGPSTVAHIHGPAPLGMNAGVILPLNVVPGSPPTGGTFNGGGTLTAPQVNDLVNGLLYVNVHSAALPGGEIRGQLTPVAPPPLDSDMDGIPDASDNAPFIPNPDQTDTDGDGIGDVADPTPFGPDSDNDGTPDMFDPFPFDPFNGDADLDGVPDVVDNAPFVFNPGQEDFDGDGIGDVADPTPFGPDSDGDGTPDMFDLFPLDPTNGDADLDGIPDASDNAPFIANPDQADTDGDGIGDVADPTPFGDATVLFIKGGAVPGVLPAATFTGFGVPAINSAGKVAFLGKWSGGSGIFADGVLVAKAGQVLSGTTAIKSVKDPVIDDDGHVSFPATLMGAGITSANDSALISNAPGGTLAIVAQEGTTAPDSGGAVWKSFQSLAAPGGGGGVLILGTLVQAGTITALNDTGVWSADASGTLHLVLQEGTTVIGGKTVKSFKALKSVSGTPGQTHAFNGSGELVAHVTFDTGEQAVAHIPLP